MKKLLFACAAAAAFGLACGNSGGSDGGTGTGSGGGTTGGGSSSGGTAGGGTTYCDGLAVQDSSGSNTIFLQYYSFSTQLKAQGCYPKLAYADAGAPTDGTSISAVGGIFDVDTSDSAPYPPALFIANCSDVGMGTEPTITDSYTPPDGGFTTVAQAIQAQGTASFWGVVTAIYPWQQGPTSYKSGTVYVQDIVADGGTPQPGSGIELYMHEGGKNNIQNNYGQIPQQGDVITVSNIKWSPYTPTGGTAASNQFEAQSGTTITKIGTAPLPPPVQVTPAAVNQTAACTPSNYEGMRVTVSGGPFKANGTDASGTCPSPLSYTTASGG